MQKQSHWAESLEIGDRVLATLRHATDGAKNRHNVEIIVSNVFMGSKIISGWDKVTGRNFEIPYNELTQVQQ